MNSNLHISTGIESVSLNYEVLSRLNREADYDIERLNEMKSELTVQIVANVLGVWDFPEHRLNEKINSNWTINYFAKRINEAYGSLQFWATIAKKDVSEIEYIKDRFIKRLTDVLNEAGRIQRGW